MKAALIEKLIQAHCSGVESEFNAAVEALAVDEEKKGNAQLSKQIRQAYSGKNPNSTLINGNQAQKKFAGMTAQSAGTTTLAPRDKESMLELYEMVKPQISLADVILPDNQKQLILQMLEENKKNENLIKHGLEPANRLLLCGPPGCGKTMTAYAIAYELKLPVAYVRLDGLVSSYLGQTSVNLRKVFDSVRNQSVVLFLDEFDAIAKKRDDENEMGELKRVVTALLQNFDSLPVNVFLIAATNHEHLLDPAIWRRFNFVIKLDLPDEQQRFALITKWLSDYNVSNKINIKAIADITVGRNTSQLKELILSAAKLFVTNNKEITTEDIVRLLFQQLTNNASIADKTEVLLDLKNKGISIRQLSRALGISHSTLSYQLGKDDKEEGNKDGE